jgi:aryl-alcohol dehydrogenase-like predicted oxidoreductase
LRDGLESKEGAENIKKVIKLSKIAEKLNISMAQLSIAWCLKNKNVSTVILGATNTKQLDENLKAAQCKSLLNDKIMESIEKIIKNKPQQAADML